jgi:GNAT superfamily N-acetyltransferase
MERVVVSRGSQWACVNTLEMWAVYADHLARLFRAAPSLTAARGDSWFAVLTREQHNDVNQCVLAPGAGAADAERVVSLIAGANVPAVISVSSEADEKVTARLARAGFEAAPLPEPLMRRLTAPTADTSRFAVARVRNQADLQTAIKICAEGHAIDQGILGRVLARDPSGDEDVSTWLAWDRDEPISVVWLTHGDHIGVWEMMTPSRHRRRGAGRAVLSAALDESWQPSNKGAFLWATPAGRPLYESFGFDVLDDATIWTTPGSEAANLAVGQAG